MNIFKNVLKINHMFQIQKRYYLSMIQYNYNIYNNLYQNNESQQVIELKNKTRNILARKKAKRKYKKKVSLRWR